MILQLRTCQQNNNGSTVYSTHSQTSDAYCWSAGVRCAKRLRWRGCNGEGELWPGSSRRRASYSCCAYAVETPGGASKCVWTRAVNPWDTHDRGDAFPKVWDGEDQWHCLPDWGHRPRGTCPTIPNIRFRFIICLWFPNEHSADTQCTRTNTGAVFHIP